VFFSEHSVVYRLGKAPLLETVLFRSSVLAITVCCLGLSVYLLQRKVAMLLAWRSVSSMRFILATLQ